MKRHQQNVKTSSNAYYINRTCETYYCINSGNILITLNSPANINSMLHIERKLSHFH